MSSTTFVNGVTLTDAGWFNDENDAVYKGVGLSGYQTIASATTPDIFATTISAVINYTGTTTCTGFVAAPVAGVRRKLVCAGAAVFTAGANMLIDGVASASNLTCAANDIVDVVAVSTTQFRLSRTAYAGTSGGSSGQPFFGLTASVGASALTATLASGTPLNFNDGTSATTSGAITVTASSGSTLGTVNNQRSRIWVVAVKNGGTPELALFNALSGINIASLPLGGTISTTAEGGAGGADSAQTWYSTTARATQPFCVVGYIESTQATAGTWASAPTAQGYGPGIALPGTPVQAFISQTGAVATGTTTIPIDDTIPQNTEGDQYLSQAITPTSSANVLYIEANLVLASSAAPNNTMGVALFQDTTANALAASINVQSVANRANEIPLKYGMVAATTSATTFKVRAGIDTAGTTTFNGEGGVRRYGGIMSSRIQIQEVQA